MDGHERVIATLPLLHLCALYSFLQCDCPAGRCAQAAADAEEDQGADHAGENE